MDKLALLPKPVTNALPREVARSLSRRNYDFKLSDRVVELVRKGEKPDPVEFKAKRPEWVLAAKSAQSENGDNANSDQNEQISSQNANSEQNEVIIESQPTHLTESTSTENAGSNLNSEKSKSTDAEVDSSCSTAELPKSDNGKECAMTNISESCDNPSSEATKFECDVKPENHNMRLPSDTPVRLLDEEGIKLRPQEKKKVCDVLVHTLVNKID